MKQTRAFQGKMSIMTQKRVLLEDETLQLHAKTFKAWMNSYLKQSGVRVMDIQQDLQDGLILIALTELITGTKCRTAYNLHPTKDIHKIDNCSIALSFIKNWIPINIEPKDIAEGNLKIILGLIWRFILHFQLLDSGKSKAGAGAGAGSATDGEGEKSVTVQGREAKKRLLEWVQQRVKDYPGVEVTNFDTSFQDGLAFSALVHSYDPALLDFNKIDKSDVAGTLTRAFEAAEKIGIPQLIDVADMVNPDPERRPDEQCMVTYISEFPRAFEVPPGAPRKPRGGIQTSQDASNQEKDGAGEAGGAGDGFEPLGIQFGEIGYMAGAPRGGRSLRYSVAQVFDQAMAHPFSIPQFGSTFDLSSSSINAGNTDSLDATGLPDHWKVQKAMSEAEIARLQNERNALLQELNRLKMRLIGVLTVGIIEARGLMGLDLRGKSDPYCIVTVERQREKTRKIKNTINPKWDTGFKFYVSEPDSVVHVTLYDWDRFLPDAFLGKLDIPVGDLPDGQQVERWYTLLPRRPGTKIAGELNLRLLYQKEK